ncbi:MAG TPA: ABC transporter substrate-binding protein [Chloroflexota bacterium]|nr:ABC transporter substrate-binding protein [Chloroflexota bacterium]
MRAVLRHRSGLHGIAGLLLAALVLGSSCTRASGEVPRGASAPAPPGPAANAPLPTAAPSPPAKVQVGVIGSPSDAGLYIAMERGYFAAQGIDAELVYFDSGARMPPAIGTEQIQVGGGVLSAGFYNLVAQEVPLKIVADKGSFSAGFGFEGLMVRKDLLDSGQVRSVADLRGRTIAHSAEANGTHFLLEVALRSGGLSDRDVNLVTMPFPDMVPALANRSIDAGMFLEPNGVRAEEQGVGVRWLYGDQIYPNYQLAVLFYSAGFVRQEDLARRFMVAYLQGVRDYNDAFVRQRNTDEVIAILAKHGTVKDPTMYRRMVAPSLHPDGLLNLDSLRQEYDWYLERGYIKNRLDLLSIIDDRFRQAAVAQLGPYR